MGSIKTFKKSTLAIGLTLGLLATQAPAQLERNENIRIPDLGSSAGSIMSPAQAAVLGDAWLRMFRAQVPTIDDPLLNQYAQNIVSSLAEHTDIIGNDLKLVIVDNESLNAFAVPGGVIGLNTGLFMLAQTEGQFASVLAHELAHLTQNHFQRRVEQQQRNFIPMIAMLLGSLALAANGQGQAGMAAITATNAAAQQSALNYSRSAEQEADRIGIQTLVAAGFDPVNQSEMFEIMKRQISSYGERYPEYLRTHPFSERRAADAALRARQYPLKEAYRASDYYYYMRVRAAFLTMTNLPALEGMLERESTFTNPQQAAAAKYGLALIYSKRNQPERALDVLDTISVTPENQLIVILARAEALRNGEQFEQAKVVLDQLNTSGTDSFPITMAKAQNAFDRRQFSECITLLEGAVETHKNNPDAWFLLSESYGLAGNLVGVHQARAEWFALNGAYTMAIRQLDLGLAQMRRESYHLIDISRAEERQRQFREQLTKAMEL